jgi:DNA-directed RNA polymerase subunit M/transcription elongation factor TFIIS
MRVRASDAMAAHLPRRYAVTLEHSCHVISENSGSSYERLVLKTLYLLEKGHVDLTLLQRMGAHAIVGMPLASLVGELPVYERIKEQLAAREASTELLRDLQSTSTLEMPDAGLRCGRCGSNDISNDFLQTRSADEGTTVFCLCKGCGKRWKM